MYEIKVKEHTKKKKKCGKKGKGKKGQRKIIKPITST